MVTAKRFDLGRTWADVLAMARSNIDVLSALAGMFVLLPNLLSGWILPERQAPAGRPATFEDMLNANAAYITAHWPIMVANALIVTFGLLTLQAVLVHGERPTVARAMQIAVVVLPFYLLANIVQTAIVSVGLILLIVPGAYAFGRFLCAAPVAVAEGRRSPFAIVARSVELTRGNGWRLVLLLVVLVLVAAVVSTVLTLVFGIAGALLLPPDLARFLNIFVGATIEAALAVTIMLVGASLYRQATAPDVSPFR